MNAPSEFDVFLTLHEYNYCKCMTFFCTSSVGVWFSEETGLEYEVIACV